MRSRCFQNTPTASSGTAFLQTPFDLHVLDDLGRQHLLDLVDGAHLVGLLAAEELELEEGQLGRPELELEEGQLGRPELELEEGQLGRPELESEVLERLQPEMEPVPELSKQKQN